jgi:O-antigen/teichoic acid export membrane protein
MPELIDSGHIKGQAIQSAKWALIARASQVLGGGILLLILPFWLAPDDFGVIAMVASVLALGLLFQQAGFSEITIQSERNELVVRDTALWLNIFFSALIYLALFLISPALGEFYRDERVTLALRVAGAQILLSGISNVPMAWLQRTFNYKHYALINAISSILVVVLGIIFAGQGWGYWAYIAGILGGAISRTVMVWLISGWFPRFAISPGQGLRVLTFGGFVLLEVFLGWILVWFDNMVVARHLGSQAAGVYSLAFQISALAISLPCSAITGLTLPMFSRMQNDPAGLRVVYMRGTSLISAYVIPAGVGLSLMGNWVAGIVYPVGWEGLGSILSILALYSGFGYLWALNTDAFKAIGRPDLLPKIYIVAAAVMLPIYWWTSQLGLNEFTVARSLVVLVGALPHTYFAIRFLHLERFYFWKTIRVPVFASLGMGAVVWVGKVALTWLSAQLSSGGWMMDVAFAGLLIVVGAGTYLALLWKLSPDFVHQTYDLFLRSAGRMAQQG